MTKWEWYRIAKAAKPKITLKQYHKMWQKFVELKRSHEL